MALPFPPRLSRHLLVMALASAMALPASALASPGYNTSRPAYVTLTGAGTVVPLINSGETLGDFTFEGIPDGIGVVPLGSGQVDLYVTHEQSHVPFGGFADFQDSSVSRVTVDTAERSIVDASVALSPSLGFIRFCSAFMAGPDQGFADYTFFVNEESNDKLSVPAGAPYGSDPSIAPLRQAGYTSTLDVATGQVHPISRLGRYNHENAVVVPGGWNKTAILSGDDTFTAPSSQLYLFTANDAQAVKADKGQLWAFQVTATDEGPVSDPYNAQNGANDYLDITAADGPWKGRFIHVPTDIARGVTSGEPQQALEDWSNANNVFQFIRVEDIAYDPDSPRTIYFTDTGATVQPDAATGRMKAGGTSNQGRVFNMVLNASDPRIVDQFDVLTDSSSIGMRRPDNVAVSANSVMVQEDTSDAKVWRYDLSLGTWTHVATANQTAAETSGIVDVSEWFGAGWWALDVQSHINLLPLGGPFTWTDGSSYNTRREDGQLLLMQIPGS
jgi:hypothetical protein